MIDAIRRYPGLTVATLIAFAILMALGFWQLNRLHQKEALLAAIHAGLAGDTRPLPAAVADPAPWAYKRVTVTGTFDHGREMHWFAPSVRDEVGYHVLTPLIRTDGVAVLVDRGWVPEAMRDAATRPRGQLAGVVTVTGIARIPRKPAFFVPAPRPERREWFGIDLAAMSKTAGYPLAPLVVEADATPNPGGLPMGGQTRVQIPNDHLQYAVTWFGFAATLIVIYIVYVRRRQ